MSTPAKFNPLGRAVLGLLALAVLSGALGRADDVPPKHRRMENRFLFVVETSSAMKYRTNGIAQAVLGLLQSGMQGELRPGDTIGLWTYDERLHADFPMQTWSEKNKDDIIADVARFLSHQHYDKRERLDKVLPEIAPLIRNSERLTVIFVFDGTQPIRGTPFDSDINDLHKQYGREFRAAHVPVVTLLAARGGVVFDYTINYPSSVVVPHTADPLPPPQTNAPPPLAAAPAPAPAPALPVEPKPPPRRFEIVMTGTNNVVRTVTPEETAAEATPPAARNIVMAVTPPPPPTLATSPPAVAKEAAPVTNAPSPPPMPASVAPLPQPAAPLPHPQPAPPAAQTAAIPASPPALAPQPAAAPPPTAAPPAAQTAAIPASSPALAPQPAAAPPPAPVEPAPAAPTKQSKPLPAPAPAVPAPVPVPAMSIGQQAALFVIAFSLLTIAIVLVIFLVRRSRGGPQPSLISQSINRSR